MTLRQLIEALNAHSKRSELIDAPVVVTATDGGEGLFEVLRVLGKVTNGEHGPVLVMRVETDGGKD